MSAQAIVTLCLLALGVGGIVGHVLGFWTGVRRGRDAQWVDDYIAAGQRDRARRERNGQFKAKEARHA